MEEAVKVEHGATGQDGDVASLSNGMDAFDGVFLKLAGGITLRWVKDVYEVMWNPRALRGIGLGRSNVHPTIDQRRIHADNLTPRVSASSMASRVLPEAVGPMIKRALGL